MAKEQKKLANYRLPLETITRIEDLKGRMRNHSQADVVEVAIDRLWSSEFGEDQGATDQKPLALAIPKPGIGKPKAIMQETGEARDARLRRERAAGQLSVQDDSITLDDDFVS